MSMGPLLRLFQVVLLALFACGIGTTASASAGPEHILSVEVSQPTPGSYADPPLRVDARALPVAWTAATLPHVVKYDERSAKKADILSLWYRVRVADQPDVRDRHLYIPRWQATGKIAIYADGRLVYAPRSGPVWNGFNVPIWTPLGTPGEPAPKEILIHINQAAGGGSALASVWVGDRQALAPKLALRRLIQIDAPRFGCELLIVTGIVMILVWLRRRKEPGYLLIIALGLLIYIHDLEYSVGLGPLPISDGWFQWWESNSEVWWITLTFFLTVQYGGGGFRRIRLALGAFATLFTVVTLLIRADIGVLKAILPLMWAGTISASAVTIVVTWMIYARAPSRAGLFFAIFTSLTFPAGVHDVFMSRFVFSPEGFYWIPWLSILQAILVLYVILDRYLQAFDLAQQSETEMAARLARRDLELSAIYERLRLVQEREVLAAERQRLMRDMHDGVGSMLIGALSAVEGGRASAPDTAIILRECIDDLKLTIDSLEPVENDLLLLLATVRYRLQPRFEKAGLVLDWRIDDLPALPSLSPDHALHILRIAQEIFTNVLKHAQATKITVSVDAEADGLVITFEDDGVGFQAPSSASPAPRGHGLRNLKSRALALKGAISWTSQPGQTRFELRLPLSQAAPATR